MIHTDLLDLINSGDAWVLVGSGVSTNAGLPSWADLVTLTLDQLSSDNQNTVKSDTRFRQWQERNDFAKCLQRMQDIAGQGAIVDIVRKIILEKTAEPSGLTRLLSDWPAAGYLTTNYDHLIEAALEINNSLGVDTCREYSE